MLDKIFELNKAWLNYLNSFSVNEYIKEIVFLFADAPIFFLPVFLVGFWIYYSFNKASLEDKQKEKIKLLTIFYSVAFSLIISIIIQQFVNIERPEQHLVNSANLLLNHIPNASFPSDHATVSFAFLTWLFLSWYKKIWYVFLPFVILMNLSRIIGWIHWPLDIIVWSLIWILGSIFVFKISKKNKFVKKVNLWIIKLSSYIKL